MEVPKRSSLFIKTKTMRLRWQLLLLASLLLFLGLLIKSLPGFPFVFPVFLRKRADRSIRKF